MDYLTRLYKAVANTKRIRIMELLLDKDELTIEEIAQKFKIPYVTAGRNMRILENVGLLKTRTSAGNVHYSINRDTNEQYLLAILATITKYHKAKH